jgi:hypothetical protein
MFTASTRFKAIASALVVAGATVPATQASAASLLVQIACAADYYAYCSKHDADGPGVRQCMRDNGEKLSSRCINALIDAGEVSKAEVERRSAANAKQ